MDVINLVVLGIFLFATTNIDDVFALLSFFADARFNARQIILGQYLGIVVLVVVSLVASLVSLVMKPQHIGLLGLFPILIGLKRLCDLCDTEADRDEEDETPGARAGNMLTVAGVTIANGGDNVGTYTPVFATSSAFAIVVFCVVFAAMVAIWLLFSHGLVNHPRIGAPIRRHGGRVAPFILIALGIYILGRARSFSLLAW